MELEKKVTIHSHMRNQEKNYSQNKEDVQLNGIQSASQNQFDKEFTEIEVGLSKIVELIQESNKDQYFGWMMKKKKVKCYALQQKQIQHSLAWRKDKELKKAEVVQRLIKNEGIRSCEHESESFLKKTNEADIKLMENLMMYFGYVEEGQLSNVVTEEKKN